MRATHTPNALPLTRSQWLALLGATARQLGWGLRAVAHEIGVWRSRAITIPDPRLRGAVLGSLADKRGHADGAALFWTLTRRRDPTLLRALVRYELLQDLLDTLTEAGAPIGPRDGGSLFAALLDALDLHRPPTDHLLRGGRDDGGYVMALVEGCRAECSRLPGYEIVRPLLIRDAHRARVLLINHRSEAAARDAELRQWAETHLPDGRALEWFERTAAASGWITTHALLTAAADVTVTRERAEAVHAAYFPWPAMTLTMLDSYADQADDRITGDHSYVGHYASPAEAAERLRESIANAAESVLALPDGERHAVLLASMVALYLSKESARAPALRATTAEIAAAGGSLTQLLLPILRAWRLCNGQRRTT